MLRWQMREKFHLEKKHHYQQLMILFLLENVFFDFLKNTGKIELFITGTEQKS